MEILDIGAFESADIVAMREDRPVVLMTTFDLTCVLEGRTLSVKTADGAAVAIRLYTPEEFLAAYEKTCKASGLPTTMTLDTARRLVAPINV